jgi:uncharacterized protein
LSQAAAGSSGAYPTLQDMLVYYNGQIGFAPTLAEALAQVFGTSPTPSTSGTSPAGGGHGSAANALVTKYLQEAEADYSAAQAALRSGDLAAFASELSQMKAALDKANAAAQGNPPAPSPSAPSPSAPSASAPSPSASP